MKERVKIVISPIYRRLIRESLGVSEATISNSLSFKFNSLLSRRIRSIALNDCHGLIMKY